MLEYNTIDNNNYLLLGIYKNNIINCATYYHSQYDNIETITSINSGEVFYNIKSFVSSILNDNEINNNEYELCNYYNEYDNEWIPLSLLII